MSPGGRRGMHVIGMKRLREFWQIHSDAQGPLRRWYKVLDGARWGNFGELRATFPHADPVTVASGTRMMVFDVGGNNYGVVARVLLEYGRVHVRLVVTQAEYGKERWNEMP